jgi:hypothetical protein
MPAASPAAAAAAGATRRAGGGRPRRRRSVAGRPAGRGGCRAAASSAAAAEGPAGGWQRRGRRRGPAGAPPPARPRHCGCGQGGRAVPRARRQRLQRGSCCGCKLMHACLAALVAALKGRAEPIWAGRDTLGGARRAGGANGQTFGQLERPQTTRAPQKRSDALATPLQRRHDPVQVAGAVRGPRAGSGARSGGPCMGRGAGQAACMIHTRSRSPHGAPSRARRARRPPAGPRRRRRRRSPHARA